MSTIQHTLDVNVPLRQVYNQWTQFEDFPQFMEGVESVRQLDDSHLHWVATVGGQRKEWDAVITEQVPDRRITWTSTTGAPNAGTVEFTPVSDAGTRVTLTIDVEPEGGVETVGDALGIPSGQVKGDLERFKQFIEERGSATGAWRGEIENGQVSSPARSSATASSAIGSVTGSSARTAVVEAERSMPGSSASRVARGSMTESELAGNVAGTGAPRTTGGGFAEGQASDLGERELAGAGRSGTTAGSGLESSTDYDRSIGQPGYGSVDTGSNLDDPLEPGATRRTIGDI